MNLPAGHKEMCMKSLVKMGLAGLFAFGLAQAAVNFPFPQSSNYGGNGVVLSNQAEAATQLKAAFDYYLRKAVRMPLLKKTPAAMFRKVPVTAC